MPDDGKLPLEPRPGPEPPAPTEALVRHARHDPAQGFGELYARVAPSLYAWASLHLREPLRRRLDPEDLLQEVCCRAYDGFATYDAERAGFRAWIFGIARNVLRHALRQLGRSGAAEGGGDAPLSSWSEVPDTATSITRRVARQEELTRFLERVQRLPEADRMLLMFRGLEGLSHREVGAMLGVEEKTAAKRWDRLCERLREEAALPPSLLA